MPESKKHEEATDLNTKDQEVVEKFNDAPDVENTGIDLADKMLPLTLHLLPVFGQPFLPTQVKPIVMANEIGLKTVEEIGNTSHHLLALALHKKPSPSDRIHPREIHAIGTVARVLNASLANNQVQIIAEGLQRFRIKEWVSTVPPFVVNVEYIEEPVAENNTEIKAYTMALNSSMRELMAVNPLYVEQFRNFFDRYKQVNADLITWFCCALVNENSAVIQDILASIPLKERMEKVLKHLNKALEVEKMHADIKSQVEASMSEQQRKFFLREQLKIIQQELGIAKDDRTADIERFEQNASELTLSEAAEKRFEDEINKLRILEPGSPEYSVTRNYLDWFTSLPWGIYSEDSLDLVKARKSLEKGHAGLDEVKERIMEFLALGALRNSVAGSIILLVGPPGVGKTSIGHAIAKAINRKFFRFSVGGMRDEAEIKGHRRTYIGAMPGKFIQALKDTGTANPVLMIDEIDKIGMSYHGDPASALLEVLDPEQNKDFLDHYLDIRFDLSQTMFICTANQIDTIPGPLYDRMEVIRLSGYITEEKLEIAQKHLWPKLLRNAGLTAKQVKIQKSALRQVIVNYAREAGVRSLDKRLAAIIRKSALKIVKKEQETVQVTKNNLTEFLGQARFKTQKPRHEVGVVTGLAWTSMGGATLDIEASLIVDAGKGLRLTGRMGETMRESAHIAYSFASVYLKNMDPENRFFASEHIHLHIPAGAVPKDGPSAGITMTSAMLSLVLGKKPGKQIAMTGEISLTGQVLPVGGIREKVVAARRSGIKKIIVPKANQADIEELPQFLTKNLEVVFAEHYDNVFKLIF